MRRLRALLTAAVAIAATAAAGRQAPTAADLQTTLARVGRQVEAFYAQARAVVCTEQVLMQPLRSDLMPEGFGRRLVYELRLDWTPPSADGRRPDAQIVRRLVSVNGRPPKPGDEPACTDPKTVSPEPLAIFLPDRANDYAFSWAGAGHTDGRAAVLLDYRDASGRPPAVDWQDDCVSVDVPAKTSGRAWIDADTSDVLRLDERFVGEFDFPVPWTEQQHGAPRSMTVERSETSIRYRRVVFSDPDETLLLPSSIDSLTVVRNAGTPRLRITQTFSGYKRFVTASRVVR